MTEKLSKTALGIYRAGVLAGIGALVFLGQNFVTRERFENYQSTHRQWSEEVIKRLDGNIADLKESTRRIENMLVNRQRAEANTAVGRK